jgi:hypothetical protein
MPKMQALDISPQGAFRDSIHNQNITMSFLAILFWILFILCCLGLIPSNEKYPWIITPRFVILLILIGILGFKLLGDPTKQ